VNFVFTRTSWWRQPGIRSGQGLARQVLVVTDVDASLLERGSRSVSEERAALDFLATRGIPLVINSSRTRAEIERLHQTLRMLTPFISEHGSALFLPRGCLPVVADRAKPAVGGDVIEFGKRYHDVVDRLKEGCREAGVDIVPFADLSIEEVAHELGIASVEAQLVKLREYTELFRLVDDRDATRSRLLKALRRRGLRCSRRGRHHLVTATPNRAESLHLLRTLWTEAWGDHVMVGLGDSEDDVAWLQHVDVAIVVQNHRWAIPARVFSKLPTVHVTRWTGRHGWSEAIFEYVGPLVAQQGGAQSQGTVHR
jgi:mannosyl-3-phosphoglycerate phosphatase family protein